MTTLAGVLWVASAALLGVGASLAFGLGWGFVVVGLWCAVTAVGASAGREG